MTHRVAKTTLPRNGRGLADCDCQASAVNKHGSERIYWFSYRTVGLGWGELRVLDHRPASRNFSLAPNHQFTHLRLHIRRSYSREKYRYQNYKTSFFAIISMTDRIVLVVFFRGLSFNFQHVSQVLVQQLKLSP